MFKQLSLVVKALKVGETLKDPATWKVRQNAINAAMSALGIILAFVPEFKAQLGLSEDDLLAIAGGIAVLGGAVNNYLTTATTRKIGITE